MPPLKERPQEKLNGPNICPCGIIVMDYIVMARRWGHSDCWRRRGPSLAARPAPDTCARACARAYYYRHLGIADGTSIARAWGVPVLETDRLSDTVGDVGGYSVCPRRQGASLAARRQLVHE